MIAHCLILDIAGWVAGILFIGFIAKLAIFGMGDVGDDYD